MRSWHDYHLIGYSVDGLHSSVTFNVLWPYDNDIDVKSANIIFTGVEAYLLKHDLGGNILYAVEEWPLKDFLITSKSFFDKEKKWGWPLFWKGSIEETLKYLNENQLKCFEISTSYGLQGWIVCVSVDFCQTKAKA
jgi:hypothetical protein